MGRRSKQPSASPETLACILFFDEADALFAKRKNDEAVHVRTMLNQLLMEWDGVSSDSKSPFVLLACNRPLDLDPAVLRRAPTHIHMDIPSNSERLGILKLLLEDEVLAPDCDLQMLVSLTPAYTGSDLTNLCVTAAMLCLREHQPDPITKEFPTRRILEKKHFIKAMKTVRAAPIDWQESARLRAFENRTI
jgi:SpoVK/Ycf46/Vps4 family AAA+-type ATPase